MIGRPSRSIVPAGILNWMEQSITLLQTSPAHIPLFDASVRKVNSLEIIVSGNLTTAWIQR